MQDAKVQRVMEFLEEPKATSGKDLAAEVGRSLAILDERSGFLLQSKRH